MSDPFAVLGVYEDFTSGSISRAFAAAAGRGVPINEARGAMDLLRDPATREAAALLAPSMTQSAIRARQRPAESPDVLDAIETLMVLLRVALTEIDASLAAEAVVPIRRFDPDEYLPSIPDPFVP